MPSFLADVVGVKTQEAIEDESGTTSPTGGQYPIAGGVAARRAGIVFSTVAD